MFSIPAEIILLIAQEHCDHLSILRLSQTCRRLRLLLNSSQRVWARAVDSKTGIRYIESGGCWRQAYFDKAFCAMCPHLSDLIANDAMEERAARFHTLVESSTEIPEIECTEAPCGIKTPHLWMCLQANCFVVGCSRATNKHIMQHFQRTTHPLSMKIDTLEFWCYECGSWIGAGPSSLTAERELCDRVRRVFLTPETEPYISIRKGIVWNDQCNVERESLELKEGDDLYLVEQGFMNRWRAFVMERKEYPGKIENHQLLVDGYNEKDKGNILVRHDVLPFRDFMCVNKENWTMLKMYHGGGPEVKVDKHIPEHDPRYFRLLEEIDAYKRQFINLSNRNV